MLVKTIDKPLFAMMAVLIAAILGYGNSGKADAVGSPFKAHPNNELRGNSMAGQTDKTNKRDLVVTRVFDAPVELVWKAWTESEHVMRWWGPNGFTSPVAKMDVREGGTSLVCMRAPKEFGGQDMYNTWTYTKIAPLQSLEFTLDWADKDGKRTDPVKMGLPPDMPRDVRHKITFKTVSANKTEMTVTEYGYTSDQHFDLSKAGLEQCLDKMAASFATGK
jgi:uncharacterized protein YndB with AHSA1/START domain